MSIQIRRGALVAAALLAGTAGLAACGDDGSSGGGSQAVTAACSLDNPPTSAAKAAPSGGSTAKASGKVGVILPDTTSSNRYELFDKPLLTKALTKAGLTADVQNAQGDKDRFASIADTMIGEGVKVLIIDSIDAPSGAGVEKKAAAAGVKVIDYDRVNLGGSAPYYVSFDNEDVGKLQAQTLVDCLDQQGIDDPNIIVMNGGTDTDNNAVLFSKGAHEVLDPLEDAGKLKIVEEATVKGWDTSKVPTVFGGAMTAAGSNVQGVLAANDGIATGVIGVLKDSGLDGRVVVTGQDATVEGLQNIVTGKQSMTIFKDASLEAAAASQLAISLINGTDPAKTGLDLQPFDDPDASGHKLQAVLLPAEVITQANVSDVVDAGALKAGEICKGIEDDCSKLGVK